jgi:hypothetical protein
MKSTLLIICLLSIHSCHNQRISCFTGIVQQIENGKDGYTAIVKADDKKIYSATISRVNMTSKYERLNIGDKATFCGDVFGSSDTLNITIVSIRH